MSLAADEKPADQSSLVRLYIASPDGNGLSGRIKRSTKLKRLMVAYCDQHSIEISSIYFLFKGRNLCGDHTPHELEMEDGDTIDAMPHLTGEVKGRKRRGCPLKEGASSNRGTAGVTVQPLGWTRPQYVMVFGTDGEEHARRIPTKPQNVEWALPPPGTAVSRESVAELLSYSLDLTAFIGSLSRELSGLQLRRAPDMPLAIQKVRGGSVTGTLVGDNGASMEEEASLDSSDCEEDEKLHDQSAYVNLKVRAEDGYEVPYNDFPRSSQLRMVMILFCDKESMELNDTVFLFNGRHLRLEDTPDELKMEDGDTIDVVLRLRLEAKAL